MKSKIKNSAMLVLTALIWGSSFVAQSVGMEHIGPFTFNSLRSFLGALVLLPVVWVMNRKTNQNTGRDLSVEGKSTRKEEQKLLLIGGVCCGVALGIGSSLQQVALLYTTAGKAGFITALYISIVPVFGLFMGKKVGIKIWLCVALAMVGMYFLCIKDGFSISFGDLLVTICSFVFAVHILIIDYFSPKVDGVKLSCIQFLVSGILCVFPMVISERPTLPDILASYLPLLYAGVLSCGVAYTLQIIAQKNTDPTVASLILSLESVFAALAGWLVIGEILSVKEGIGCGLVFSAIILVQLPQRRVNRA